jgi:hypothetical protein
MGTAALTFLDRLGWGIVSGIVRGAAGTEKGFIMHYTPHPCKSPMIVHASDGAFFISLRERPVTKFTALGFSHVSCCLFASIDFGPKASEKCEEQFHRK